MRRSAPPLVRNGMRHPSSFAVPLLLAGLLGAAVAAPGAKTSPTTPPPVGTIQGARLTFSYGVVKFVDREDLPRTNYTIRGKLEVTFSADFIVSKNLDTGETYVFPARKLIFAGNDDFDRKDGD